MEQVVWNMCEAHAHAPLNFVCMSVCVCVWMNDVTSNQNNHKNLPTDETEFILYIVAIAIMHIQIYAVRRKMTYVLHSTMAHNN